MLNENIEKSNKLKKLLQESGFGKTEIGLAIIDLNQNVPEIFGYNIDHFIYPASVYKIFIGAETLRQIEVGILGLDQIVKIKSPNDVDKDAKIFPSDTRKILCEGDEVTIDHLLDLMLTRSDNTASNTLMDIVGRENINQNIIYKYGWQGSEVTRKFLDRIKEDKPYQYSQTTMSCARHVAEFFYLVEKGQLISHSVSNQLKQYMLRWNRGGRQGLYIKDYIEYYRKGGYLENNLYKHGLLEVCKGLLKRGWAFIHWNNDAGVVRGQKSHYVIAFFSVNKQINPYKKLKSEKLAKLVYEFMEN